MRESADGRRAAGDGARTRRRGRAAEAAYSWAVLAAAADTSFSLAPGPILIVVLLPGCTSAGGGRCGRRGPRAARRGRGWRAWLGGHAVPRSIALISPIDTLADQVFAMHMVQHVLLLDFAPILLILGLTKVLLRPIARTVLDAERALGPIAHPVFAVVLLRRRDVDLAHPGALRRRAEALRHPRPRAHVLPQRRPPVLVAPALPRPRPPPRRAWRRSATWSRRRSSSACSGSS